MPTCPRTSRRVTRKTSRLMRKRSRAVRSIAGSALSQRRRSSIALAAAAFLGGR